MLVFPRKEQTGNKETLTYDVFYEENMHAPGNDYVAFFTKNISKVETNGRIPRLRNMKEVKGGKHYMNTIKD